MAITVAEKWESRELTTGDHPTQDMIYLVSGTEDDYEAWAACNAYAPDERYNLRKETIHVKRIGQEDWIATVAYGRSTSESTGDSKFSFDTTGGTQHITQSLGTVSNYAASGTAPDFKGAIGVSDKGDVEGCDITVPIYKFQETHYIAEAYVTQAYKMTLFGLTGCMNTAPFRGLAAGECLFLGAQGTQRGSEDWEITFAFAGSPTLTDLTVGDITGIIKRGWDYLWMRYADAVDSGANMLVKRPVSAHVEQVYRWGNFNLLNLG